jgi:Ni/Fe-hydrogenase subunit HybB-like protein
MMPIGWGAYWPSRVEIAITLAAAAAVPLMLMLFFRVFPILSIYEIEEIAEQEREHEPEPALEPGQETAGVAAW